MSVLVSFALSALSSCAFLADEFAVGGRPTHTFAEEPFGLPGLRRLEELRGAAVLIVRADPAHRRSFSKIAAAATALVKRYSRDLTVIVMSPSTESSWREAHAQRCFAGGLALTTEQLFRAPAAEQPFAVVLDAFGEVVHAEFASLDLDEARKAIEIAVSNLRSAEAYAPQELADVWKSFEKGFVQRGFDELAQLEGSSDPLLRRTAAVAREWWQPRLTSPIERAERLLAEERWCEARSLLDELLTRFRGLAKAQDSFAERVRAARAKLPLERSALAADQALDALTREILTKGASKVLREKLAELANDSRDERVAARARSLLLRLAP
jgi:hypothetical protein